MGLGPTTPGKWGPTTPGTGATITWSIMGGALDVDGIPSSVGLGSFLPAGYVAEIQQAFDDWEAIANIDFVSAADPGVGWLDAGAEAVDIRIGGHFFDGPGFVLAHGFFPPLNPGSGPTPDLAAAGDIHLDSADFWKIGFGASGFDIRQVVSHEIGHAIGFEHTAIPGSLLNPFYTEAFAGPQADEIAGAVYLYGAPVTTNSPGPTAMIPEPATITFFGIGLIGLGAARRRAARKIAA